MNEHGTEHDFGVTMELQSGSCMAESANLEA